MLMLCRCSFLRVSAIKTQHLEVHAESPCAMGSNKGDVLDTHEATPHPPPHQRAQSKRRQRRHQSDEPVLCLTSVLQ